jgi:pimeloyl-ACP methyl ester carboxylesterase
MSKPFYGKGDKEHSMKRSVYMILLLALFFLPVHNVKAQDSQPGNYRQVECVIKGTEMMGAKAECGILTVPELHNQPNGRTIELSVVKIKSTSENPLPDPLIMAQGGPGGSTIDTYSQMIAAGRLATLLADRDIILFDQRGTLNSKPNLLCPELVKLAEDTIDKRLSNEEGNKKYEETLQVCHQRLLDEGVNLAAYNSLENAADIETLRKAMGYQKINLYGVSYGTLLALHTIKTQPQALRSVILDSVVPTQVNFILNVPQTFNRSLTELFNACKQDPKCTRDYPDLEKVYFEVVEQLNKTPAKIEIRDRETKKVYQALMDGNTFKDITFQFMYVSQIIPLMPKLIFDARKGEFGLVQWVWPLLVFDRTMSYGMYQSVMCAEDGNFSVQQMDLNGVRPKIAEGQQDDAASFLRTCRAWNVPELGQEVNQPVQSDIPVLIFNGQFDPITPPQYGEMAGQTLKNHYLFTFPANGHGALGDNECSDEIAREFLDNPSQKPQAACFADLTGPRFITNANIILTRSMRNIMAVLDSGDFGGLGLLLVSWFLLLSVFLVWPLVWVINKFRHKPSDPRGQPKLALLSLLGLVTLSSLFLIGLVTALFTLSFQGKDILMLVGLPVNWGMIFLFGPVIGILVLMVAIYAVLAWVKGYWGIGRRLYFSLMALSSVVMGGVMLQMDMILPIIRSILHI